MDKITYQKALETAKYVFNILYENLIVDENRKMEQAIEIRKKEIINKILELFNDISRIDFEKQIKE